MEDPSSHIGKSTTKNIKTYHVKGVTLKIIKKKKIIHGKWYANAID